MSDMQTTRANKRRRLSPPSELGSNPPSNHDLGQSDIAPPADFIKQAAGWDLEQVYEQKARKHKGKVKEHTRLPIKTAEGNVEQLEILDGERDGVEGVLDTDDNESQASQVDIEPPIQIPIRQQILNAKEELAKIASQINEDPEEHVSGFRALSRISGSSHPTIKKLALAAQMAVYRDAIPGYRIRPLSGTDQKEKLSKEVRSLRNFEQSLVNAYQAYLKDLASSADRSSGDSVEASASVASVAISCACALLLAVPHFNFRAELLKIVIGKVASKNKDANQMKCLETLETLFHDDDDGTSSFEAVGLLAKMIRTRSYQVDGDVLNTFLHLRLLSEFSSKASQDRIDKPSLDSDVKEKKPKFKKEFRTKKQRKVMKEQKQVEKEFKEAGAIVDHEHRDQMQAETLKLVFGTYFRVLKARNPLLTGAVLEGLAKYAHLINQDFFGDLLEVLKDLIKEVEKPLTLELHGQENQDATSSKAATQDATRASLLCVTTAFALLEGQDVAKSASSLGLDLTFFTTFLYKSLYSLAINPDVEVSAKTVRLTDSDSTQTGSSNAQSTSHYPSKINVQTTSVLLLRALSAILKPRSTPPIRLAAFTKQIYTTSLHLPEKSSLAMLSLLNNIAKEHTRKIAALWNSEERRADGVFDPFRAEIEGSNPFATSVWEGELMMHHFCPGIREASKAIEKIVGNVA